MKSLYQKSVCITKTDILFEDELKCVLWDGNNEFFRTFYANVEELNVPFIAQKGCEFSTMAS